jgi:iron complex transport system permease protein
MTTQPLDKPRAVWTTIRPHALPISFRVGRRVLPVALALLAFALVVLILSVSYGEYDIPPLDVVRTILGIPTEDARNHELVIWTFRLPRILLAFLVGAALGVSGTLMQGVTRNPLADPGLLGVSAGASLAAVSLLLYFDDVPLALLPFAAFGGALLAAVTIYALAWKHGGSATIRLILIGIALEAVLAALLNLLIIFGDIREVQQAFVWLTGSVYGRDWDYVATLGLWLLVLLPLAFVFARQLNVLNLGDEPARGLGQRVEGARLLLMTISVGLAAAAVAVSGTIGFVGLVVPHITRRLVGPAHEGLLPISALFGGALLMLADLIGRWVISPSELPVGIVTAIIGAPYFLYLLYRNRHG